MKYTILLIILPLICFTVYSCGEDHKNRNSVMVWGNSKEAIRKQLDSLFQDSLVSGKFAFFELPEASYEAINPTVAKKISLSFIEDVHTRRIGNPGHDKSKIEKSVTFNYPIIYKVIDSLINAETNPNQFPNKDLFGVRIYLGFYNNSDDDISRYLVAKDCLDYVNRYTTVAVITYNDINVVTQTIPYKNTGRLINTYLNLGGLCPPGCPAVTSCQDIQ